MARKLGAAVAFALAFALPAGAHAAVLHDQTDSLGFNAIASEDFQPSQDTVDSKVADDFTVPAGQSWTLLHMDVVGDEGGGPPPFVNFFLYASAGTLPGNELFHQSHVPAAGYPNYSAPISAAPSLDPGTYWIVMQEDGGGFMVPSWAWHGRNVQDGNQAAFQGNSGWGNGCETFTPIHTCFPASDIMDMAWKIEGIAASQQVSLGKLKRARNGTARITVSTPGPGTVTLHSGQVKTRTAFLGTAGSVKLLIKAIGKQRKRLFSRGRAKVKIQVRYTAPGASWSTVPKTVKLKRR